jgi:hypothetical protein
MHETIISAAPAALAAVSPAIAGYEIWIFEQESPPVWELFCEVNRKIIINRLDFALHNSFPACDVGFRQAD